jgi:hypothetical protein
MTRSRSPVVLAIVVAIAGSCASSAGPFITHIKSAGPGRVTVEKCVVEYNPSGCEGAHISNEQCTREVVELEQAPPPYTGAPSSPSEPARMRPLGEVIDPSHAPGTTPPSPPPAP